jgi:hypothetical protein
VTARVDAEFGSYAGRLIGIHLDRVNCGMDVKAATVSVQVS